MNIPQDDKIKQLVARDLTGQASAEEQRQLQEWMSADAKNREFYDSWKRLYDLSKDSHAPEPDVNVEAEWQQFLERIDEKKIVRFRTPASRWSTLVRAAAGLALLFAITFLLNYFLFSERETVFQTADATETIWLPDSTQITLNRNSSLSFKGYGKINRSVNLSGEAFFDVKPNAHKPFMVMTGGASITVVGTSFNVRAEASSPTVEVVVATGVVRLASAQNANEVQLSAGDKGIFSKADQQVQFASNTDINYNAWKTRKLIFDGSTLSDAIETINQVYGAHVTIASNVSSACEVTVTFEQQTLDAILNVLQSTLSLQYERSGDRIQIVSAECN
ncbi:MAG: FecR domain-containing protein [Cyclobacteriaceae bacterium]